MNIHISQSLKNVCFRIHKIATKRSKTIAEEDSNGISAQASSR